MSQNLNKLLVNASTVALGQTSDPEPVLQMFVGDVMAVITKTIPSNGAFTDAEVDVTANTITIASHGFTTGLKVTFTTDGTLPAPLVVLTPYYVIVVDANTIKVATTQALALAGTAVDLTTTGTGNDVAVVDTTLAGTVKLQKSDDPVILPFTSNPPSSGSWFDIPSSSQSFSATVNLNWVLDPIGYNWIRAVVAVTSGAALMDVRINAKGM